MQGDLAGVEELEGRERQLGPFEVKELDLAGRAQSLDQAPRGQQPEPDRGFAEADALLGRKRQYALHLLVREHSSIRQEVADPLAHGLSQPEADQRCQCQPAKSKGTQPA